jgi:hypothetical protein
LGYGPREILAVTRTGITARTQDILHLHRRLRTWGPHLWHVVVDEHVQGVVEHRFVSAPAERATWLEEGLSSYLAHTLLREMHPTHEAGNWNRAVAAVFKAWLRGDLPRLQDISTKEAWYTNIPRGRDVWLTQYAWAWIAVVALVETHGLEAVLGVFERIARGRSLAQALNDELGVSLKTFETRLHYRLVVLAMQGPYRGAGILSGALLLGLLAAWRVWRRKRTR